MPLYDLSRDELRDCHPPSTVYRNGNHEDIAPHRRARPAWARRYLPG